MKQFKIKAYNAFKFYVVFPPISILKVITCAMLDIAFYMTFCKFFPLYKWISDGLERSHFAFTRWATQE